LDANPTVGNAATILGDYSVTSGEFVYFAFTAPSVVKNFYAALIDAEGTYNLVPFTSGQRSLDFSQMSVTKSVIDANLLNQQVFSYCYEDEMPEPGDYDYNDLVLRISQEHTAQNQIILNVTLAAVGSRMQMAAAVRLLNYKFEDIESVTTLDNENFNLGYKKSALPYIDSDQLLMKGVNGEAVINLFEDAHWATGAANYTSEGYLQRFKYNVSKTTDTEHDMMSPRTVSFVVTFKNPGQLNYFTMSQLDPFAVIRYSGGLREIHALYQYHSSMVLYEFRQPDTATILPWALVVPSGSFRYPLDGVNVGFSRSDALFGAYMTAGHSFGEWAADHMKVSDWYNYPTGNMVY